MTMIFSFGIKNKYIKDLRKDQGLTAKELAEWANVDLVEILNIDSKKLKEIDEPLKSKILPILNGDYMDDIPW